MSNNILKNISYSVNIFTVIIISFGKVILMAKFNVISHRGANLVAPQNTLPAFEKSIEIGVDGFETDIHLTSDGVPVVCHNYTIDETSDGTGEVNKMTYDELRAFDFGSYFHEKFKGTKAPSLEEFYTLCESADIEIMNVEIKPPLDGNMEIVAKTIDAAKAHGLFDKLLISSFSADVLVECKKVDPQCKTGFLYAPNKTHFYKEMVFGYVKFAKKIKADYLHPHFSAVTKRYCKKLHENGIGINVWTVDKPSTITKMMKCGVDGLITNDPETCKALIARFGE